MSNDKSSSRTLYPELLRVFACLAVILIHTGNNGASRVLKYSPERAAYWQSLFFTVYIRFAVPVFLGISGAFLLGRKDEPLGKQIARIVRVALVLFIFSLIFYLDDTISAGERFNLLYFLKVIYSSNTKYVLWYLYAYLAFLVSLPLLRPLAQNLSNRGFLYMFGLVILLGSLIPCMEVLILSNRVHYNQHLSLAWLCENIVVYPMFGYYFHNRLDPERDIKDWWWIWPAAIAAIVLTSMTIHRLGILSGGLTVKILRGYVGKFDLLHAASVFVMARCLCTRLTIPDWAARFIAAVGSCTFGIYLIHIFFIEKGLFRIIRSFFRSKVHMGGLTSTVLACLCIMMICYVIIWVLKKIPGIRKLL